MSVRNPFPRNVKQVSKQLKATKGFNITANFGRHYKSVMLLLITSTSKVKSVKQKGTRWTLIEARPYKHVQGHAEFWIREAFITSFNKQISVKMQSTCDVTYSLAEFRDVKDFPADNEVVKTAENAFNAENSFDAEEQKEESPQEFISSAVTHVDVPSNIGVQ